MPDGDEGTNVDADDGDAGERLASAYPEPDPEGSLADPESELPNVPSPPSVDIPTPGQSEGDVPGELLAGFWSTVLVFNVALLATSLGLLLLGFGEQRRLGAGALAVGLLAAVHGYWKYRSLSDRHRRDDWSDGPAADEPPEVDGNDSDGERTDPADERNG